MVNKLGELLGLNEGNTLVAFILESVQETVKNYCNIEEIPNELDNTVLRMAIGLYRNEQLGDSSSPLTVKSITEGDTSTSFQVGGNNSFEEGVLKDYKKQLNRFRRVRFK